MKDSSDIPPPAQLLDYQIRAAQAIEASFTREAALKVLADTKRWNWLKKMNTASLACSPPQQVFPIERPPASIDIAA